MEVPKNKFQLIKYLETHPQLYYEYPGKKRELRTFVEATSRAMFFLTERGEKTFVDYRVPGMHFRKNCFTITLDRDFDTYQRKREITYYYCPNGQEGASVGGVLRGVL